jgi:hypothetical protein
MYCLLLHFGNARIDGALSDCRSGRGAGCTERLDAGGEVCTRSAAVQAALRFVMANWARPERLSHYRKNRVKEPGINCELENGISSIHSRFWLNFPFNV